MSKIYIIRHGQTIWNVEGKFQGWQNSDLTKKGKEQAARVGVFLQDKNIEKIYCSPLQRCRDTLEIVLTQNSNFGELETIFDDNLRECNYGDIEGMEENVIRTQLLLQGIDRRDPAIKFSFRFENGENYSDQLKRIMEFELENDIVNSTLNSLIVCHNGSLKLLEVILRTNIVANDILEAIMWQPSNSVVVVFDVETGISEILDLDSNL